MGGPADARPRATGVGVWVDAFLGVVVVTTSLWWLFDAPGRRFWAFSTAVLLAPTLALVLGLA
jgi:hypothetical protein